MAVSEASVVIACPVGEAWGYITNAANLPVWEPAVVDAAKITEGPAAVGTKWRGTNRVLGLGWKWVGEMTQVDVNKTTEFRSTTGKLGFVATTRFEELDGGTRFTYRLESASGLGEMFGKGVAEKLVGRLLEPIVAAVYRRELRASLDHLADVLAVG